ncbi:hypothetical protein AAFP35_08420 [Gordonia sp. CPCC 206044]|uniref:hypothetical protein n=1 Tax=Gordonia sp. CPCC 206044 TaxID=3140793 RepID=UPI003AF3C258
MRDRPVAWICLSVAVLLGVVGCASAMSQLPVTSPSVTPVTVTVTATPSTPDTRDQRPSLADGFRRATSSVGVPVGVAVAPVGGDPAAVLALGDGQIHVAWSTIKVPLAVAAERESGISAAEEAAIVNSDNASAEQLWASLGSSEQAAAAVTAVLREGGDDTTLVPSRQRRQGFTTFGQTPWSLPSAAVFTANLECMPGTSHVVDLMGRVGANQQWGVEDMAAPASIAVKGGWGPGITSGYLVRQIGLVRFGDGRATAIAMSAVAASMDGGIAALDVAAGWLDDNLTRLPRGRC